MSHPHLHYSWAENGQLYCHSLAISSTSCGSRRYYSNPLTLPNSDVIVMSKLRLGNFHIKNNLCKNFCDVNFLQFICFAQFFWTVDGYNMKCSWRLVYCQVSRELSIAGCGCRLDIYLGRCGCAHKHWSLLLNFFFFFIPHVKLSWLVSTAKLLIFLI